MAQADANRTSLYYSVETAFNEVPTTPTMNEIQRTADDFQHAKTTAIPTTIRADRMQEDPVRVGDDATGSFNFEFRHTQYDALIAAVIGAGGAGAGGYTVVSISAADISAAASDDSFNRAAGSFITDGVVVGMWVRVAGFTGAGVTADNGTFKVLTVAALKITVDAALVDDAAGETVTITAKMARNGVVNRSFLLEKRFNDIAIFQQLRGMTPNVFSLDFRTRAILTGALSFVGAQGLYTGATVAGSSVAAATNPAMDSSGNIVSLYEGGIVVSSPIFSMTLNINANAAGRPAIANRYPIGVRLGVLEISGTVELYFEDATLANKFINHTMSSLELRMLDGNGKAAYLTIPRLFYTEGQTPVRGENQDIFLTMPFRASAGSAAYDFQFDSLA
jgi:hypothetical protein